MWYLKPRKYYQTQGDKLWGLTFYKLDIEEDNVNGKKIEIMMNQQQHKIDIRKLIQNT